MRYVDPDTGREMTEEEAHSEIRASIERLKECGFIDSYTDDGSGGVIKFTEEYHLLLMHGLPYTDPNWLLALNIEGRPTSEVRAFIKSEAERVAP